MVSYYLSLGLRKDIFPLDLYFIDKLGEKILNRCSICIYEGQICKQKIMFYIFVHVCVCVCYCIQLPREQCRLSRFRQVTGRWQHLLILTDTHHPVMWPVEVVQKQKMDHSLASSRSKAGSKFPKCAKVRQQIHGKNFHNILN